jgi:uncharacterized protein (DUF488 family)
MSPQLFSIGHSTHPFERFLSLLTEHGIQVLADIRRFPGSRKYPHFSRDNLSVSLPEAGIEYQWLPALGGRRGKSAAGTSKNLGFRSESFRNYADYMLTQEFRDGIQQLLTVAGEKRTALMCSESVFWRCHRRLVSDYLLVQGITVQHIMPSGELQPHGLTKEAVVTGGEVTYPAPKVDQGRLLFE